MSMCREILLVVWQDEFTSQLHTLVTRKQKFKLCIEEGWYSEQEMKDELNWTQWGLPKVFASNIWFQRLCIHEYSSSAVPLDMFTDCSWSSKTITSPFQLRTKIDGAKARCLAMPETHVRPGPLWIEPTSKIVFSPFSWMVTTPLCCGGPMLTMACKSFGSSPKRVHNGPNQPATKSTPARSLRPPAISRAALVHLLKVTCWISCPCQAAQDPTNPFEKKFTGWGALENRDQKEKTTKLEDPKHDKYAQDRVLWSLQDACFVYSPFENMFHTSYSLLFPWVISTALQTKCALKKTLDAMISKSGKLRSLARDLSTNYSDESAKGCLFWSKDKCCFSTWYM